MADPITLDVERALASPGDALAPAALAVAQLEHPRLDPQPYLAQLDDFGRDAVRRIRELAGRREQILALNDYMFTTLGFAGNVEQYLDPRNSFLNDVMDRRLGIPITLSVVYIEVGRRVGLPLSGVAFPGHFLVRCEEPGSRPHVIDPFNRGRLLSEAACVTLLREHAGENAAWHPSLLEPAGRREIVVRMLNNLKRAYVALRSFTHARRASDLLLALDPSAITELRDRGLLSYHLQDFSSALHDLERYLKVVAWDETPEEESEAAEFAEGEGDDQQGEESEESEFKTIWEHVKNLRRRVAGLN